jgi:hypothetical protein
MNDLCMMYIQQDKLYIEFDHRSSEPHDIDLTEVIMQDWFTKYEQWKNKESGVEESKGERTDTFVYDVDVTDAQAKQFAEFMRSKNIPAGIHQDDSASFGVHRPSKGSQFRIEYRNHLVKPYTGPLNLTSLYKQAQITTDFYKVPDFYTSIDATKIMNHLNQYSTVNKGFFGRVFTSLRSGKKGGTRRKHH